MGEGGSGDVNRAMSCHLMIAVLLGCYFDVTNLPQMWITGAGHANWFFVMAKTDTEAKPGSAFTGRSLLCVRVCLCVCLCLCVCVFGGRCVVLVVFPRAGHRNLATLVCSCN